MRLVEHKIYAKKIPKVNFKMAISRILGRIVLPNRKIAIFLRCTIGVESYEDRKVRYFTKKYSEEILHQKEGQDKDNLCCIRQLL